jgi:hypothetical protein
LELLLDTRPRALTEDEIHKSLLGMGRRRFRIVPERRAHG